MVRGQHEQSVAGCVGEVERDAGGDVLVQGGCGACPGKAKEFRGEIEGSRGEGGWGCGAGTGRCVCGVDAVDLLVRGHVAVAMEEDCDFLEATRLGKLAF